ncbi:HNH endonuclease [Streptomyces sp. DSM 42041]|uniref:HNH endonuclease n=1 Tax=Streptomyces hazeniae TaxID=3075538 RepID=A0ABU2NT69_9ACTN|nr:HNH endonuclease [Streptomyces sp. DSM 42041]MDT0379806.1 HNH endonuclease [Streptomyces sp. DSM 42041]
MSVEADQAQHRLGQRCVQPAILLCMIPAEASEHDESRAPDGTPWWELSIQPGTKKKPFGQERRLAAWLWFNKHTGDTFTMRELRAALGADIVESSEHLNRRLRELRKCDWEIPSQRNDATLAHDEYRLRKKGGRLWLDSERAKYERFAPSARIRRLIMDQDGSRCRICGLGVDDTYPEDGSNVRLTIGHLVPQERLRSRGARDDLNNWRTECSRCNETVRDEVPDPDRYDEVLAGMKRLTINETRELLNWMRKGERVRSRVDQAYDRARKLPIRDRNALIDHLSQRVGETS